MKSRIYKIFAVSMLWKPMETAETVSMVSTGFQFGFHGKVRIIKLVSAVSNIFWLFWRKKNFMIYEHVKFLIVNMSSIKICALTILYRWDFGKKHYKGGDSMHSLTHALILALLNMNGACKMNMMKR